jgi:hypothetical protein
LQKLIFFAKVDFLPDFFFYKIADLHGMNGLTGISRMPIRLRRLNNLKRSKKGEGEE